MVREGVHVYVSSSDSIDIFPENSPADFIINLPQPLQFTGSNWYCGVTQIILPSKSTSPIHLLTDFTQSVIVGSRQYPALCQIASKSKEYTNVAYVPLKVNELSTMHFKLIKRGGDLVYFKSGETFITLHFTQWPT